MLGEVPADRQLHGQAEAVLVASSQAKVLPRTLSAVWPQGKSSAASGKAEAVRAQRREGALSGAGPP